MDRGLHRLSAREEATRKGSIMTSEAPWDWPPERRARVDINVTHHTRTPWLQIALAMLLVAFLSRFYFVVILLFAMLFNYLAIAAIVVVPLLAFIAWRERRHGRPF